MNDVTSMHARRTAMGPAAEISEVAVAANGVLLSPDRLHELQSRLAQCWPLPAVPAVPASRCGQTVGFTLETPVTEASTWATHSGNSYTASY
jgi:hypothetical protein